MNRKRTTVRQLASEAGIEVDEALIGLWDAGFDLLKAPTDAIPRREANRARRALGLATRRELSTPEYWQKEYRLTPEAFDAALRSLGVAEAYDGGRLRQKAINRLQSERRWPNWVSEDVQQQYAYAPSHTKWEIVGHQKQLRQLSLEDVHAIHMALVEDFKSADDPIQPSGTRSIDLLASAVSRPQTSLGDTLKYPTVEMAGAALFHSIIHNHPFHNGNKRTALVALLVYLDENGMLLTCDEDELFKLVLQVAQHSLVDASRNELADRETLAIATWLNNHARWVENGDRAVTWRKLEQILAGFGCTFDRAGSNVTIRRIVSRRVRYLPWLSKTRVLTSQAHFGGLGREISKSAVKKLRRDLHLDDDNGVDSNAFYDDASVSTSDFIRRYRKTLRRLARL